MWRNMYPRWVTVCACADGAFLRFDITCLLPLPASFVGSGNVFTDYHGSADIFDWRHWRTDALHGEFEHDRI